MRAAMVGLGLALAQPDRRVLVVTGDGERLMGLGALATIGVQRPQNLSIAVDVAADFARDPGVSPEGSEKTEVFLARCLSTRRRRQR